MIIYMKKLVFILTFFFLFCHQLQAQVVFPCAEVKVEPKIKFSTSYGQLSYDFSKNTKTISQIAARIGNKERSSFATGLATVNVDNEYVLGTQAYPLENKRGYCVVPEVIDVYVGFSRPIIYISNELPKNSCQYNLVMLHEQTHQRINKTALDYFIPYFQYAADQIAQEMAPRYIQNLSQIDQATDDITQEFTQRFDKVLAVFKKELALEQSKLDNQTNYSIEDDICRNFNAKHFRR